MATRMATRWIPLVPALLAPLGCSVDSSGLHIGEFAGTGGTTTTPVSKLDANPGAELPLATGGIKGGGGSGGMGGIGGSGGTGGAARTGGTTGAGGVAGNGGVRPAGGALGTGGVIRPDGGRDANPSPPEARPPRPEVGPEVTSGSICAGSGGQYNGSTCVFDCTTQSACTGVVTCPYNQPCQVISGPGGCAGGVDCSQGATRNITCGQTGQTDACAGPVRCGGSECTITCAGTNACRGGVTSVAAGTQITCDGVDSCLLAVNCSGNRCDTTCAGNCSCAAGINTTAANNVVRCAGRNSCALTVNCSGATCEVACSGGGGANCAAGVNCNAGGGTCP